MISLFNSTHPFCSLTAKQMNLSASFNVTISARFYSSNAEIYQFTNKDKSRLKILIAGLKQITNICPAIPSTSYDEYVINKQVGRVGKSIPQILYLPIKLLVG